MKWDIRVGGRESGHRHRTRESWNDLYGKPAQAGVVATFFDNRIVWLAGNAP
jgi:hypothetical protein